MPKAKEQPKRAKTESLVKPGKKGSIELSEADLKKVGGGLKLNTIKID